MKRFLKEPLLHFLLLGAGIFLIYYLASEPANEAPDEIIISRGQIENLATVFAKAWQRPPTAEELDGLVRDRVREEVYCREAMTLGLDQDDTVIRRRLRQKMEFISDDIAAQAEATDAELETYLKSHADAFRVEPRFTFRQVFLDPEKTGKLPDEVIRRLAQLNGQGDAADLSTLSDSLMLESDFKAEPAGEVAKQFGDAFAAKLAQVPVGQWEGPVESGYGLHLVKVVERTEARLPALADVRDAVLREWSNARRMEENAAFYQELLKRYKITIEPAFGTNLATTR